MGVSPALFDQLDALGDWGLLATDTDLVVTGWNRWLERHSGLPREGVIGRPLYALFPDLPARGLDRYFRQALAGQTAILSQRFHRYVVPLDPAAGTGHAGERMQQSGRIVPLLTGAAVTGALAVIEDVTERVARETELQARGRQQAALAASARSALAGDDIADLCREAVAQLAATVRADLTEALELQDDGDTWARLAGTGWSDADPVAFRTGDAARTLSALCAGAPELTAGTDAQLLSRGVAGGLVVRIPGRDARPFGLLGAYARSPREFNAEEVQFVRALADIIGTAVERKRLEAELRVRAAELSEADRRKDEFLAMLAHELRNPLAPVRNAVQILQATRAADPLVARTTDMMGRQIEHMAHMVDDLLDVSRITRGKVTLRRDRVLLDDAIARAVETARPLIEARCHTLEVTVPPEPVTLDADPTRLVQVLGNLLNNAAKYTEDGGRIWLTAARDGAEAVVRVRDTGIGLTPAMIPRVFDLFAQEHHTLDRSQGGLGIGLTLVRSLVELHGGSVGVSSDGRDRGSEFVVRFPALPVGTELAAQPEEPDPAPASRRFLIVDDNVDSAESLAELLTLIGHEVRTAHTGPAALADAQGRPPEVVLLDIGLPQMNGYEVARRMRQFPGFTHVTLIAMTGYGQDEDRRRSHEAGFDHHLVKPVGLDDIRRLLGSIPGPPRPHG